MAGYSLYFCQMKSGDKIVDVVRLRTISKNEQVDKLLAILKVEDTSGVWKPVTVTRTENEVLLQINDYKISRFNAFLLVYILSTVLGDTSRNSDAMFTKTNRTWMQSILTSICNGKQERLHICLRNFANMDETRTNTACQRHFPVMFIDVYKPLAEWQVWI